MYEDSCNVSTTLWSPDPESFSGLRKRKSDCAPSSPLSDRINQSSTLIAPLSAPPQQCL